MNVFLLSIHFLETIHPINRLMYRFEILHFNNQYLQLFTENVIYVQRPFWPSYKQKKSINVSGKTDFRLHH